MINPLDNNISKSAPARRNNEIGKVSGSHISGLNELPQEDMFVRADDANQKPAKDLNPIIYIDLSASKEREEKIKKIQKQLEYMQKQCRTVVDKLGNHPIIESVRVSSNDPKKLSQAIADFVRLVESKVPELQYDQPGWRGNDLKNFIDTNKAPQFICDGEASIVIEILKHLQSKGILNQYDIHPEETGSYGSHTAVGVSKKGEEKKSDAIFILDPWFSPPGKNPEVFVSSEGKSAKAQWEERLKELSQKEKQEEKDFEDSWKYRTDKEKTEEFIRKWWDKNKNIATWGYYSSSKDYDYIFLKYYAGPKSNLRFAIPPDYFNLMRDKIVHSLKEEGKLDKLSQETLWALNLKGKSTSEAKKVWDTLNPYLELYFNTLYPNNKTVKQVFCKESSSKSKISLKKMIEEVETICEREKIKFPREVNLIEITKDSKSTLDFYKNLKENNYKDSEGKTPFKSTFVNDSIEIYSKEVEMLENLLAKDNILSPKEILGYIVRNENKKLEELKKIDPKDDPYIERKIYVQRAITYHFSTFRDDFEKYGFFEPELNMLLTKAAFNLTKTPGYLNKFLPLRSYLTKNDLKKLETYDEQVKYLLSEVKFIYKKDCKITEKDLQELKADKPLDDFEKYMIAAPIVELFINKPNIVKQVVEGDSKKLTIVMTNNIDSNAGEYGSYVGEFNMIFIVDDESSYDSRVLPRGAWDYFKKVTTSSTIQHEFVHAIDYLGNQGKFCEGIFHDMTRGQKERFIKIRNKFINKQYDEGTPLRYKMPEYALNKVDNGKYIDFPTVTCMLFIYRPNDLKEISPELYKLYIEYFGLDPIAMKYPNRD